MKIKTWVFAWLLALLFWGCSTTTLTGIWQDPEYAGKTIKKILVVGISAKEVHRRQFEDQFSQKLNGLGLTAVASYTLFNEEELRDKNKVSARLRELQFDAMLISQMTGQRSETVQQPGRTYVLRDHYYPPTYHLGWYPYYTYNYEIIHEPPYTVEYKVIIMESNLYEVATDKLIWGVTSETIVRGSIESLIKTYIKVVSDELTKAQLF